ncbi:prolipoprotein diacylglyceryl transferase [Clostridium bowmanii]|uniref:prolipoprotein diacylglyceryl transferase n=1 Tax=Clostridium bowmanii TaxID=132925 RepID=UPI001C0D8541|nr:prolipoprotein diacylglyceryl transferase family protein [Clostridium bowmanii]MBU3190357.1 prolipoprotein diacylglyceryl transferase [Clostridium bowmanii]MCA1074869.1 prolipoprotein diacylglyceryl transferase [Clostridium bowmanii]
MFSQNGLFKSLPFPITPTPNEAWGIKPVLFKIGNFPIEAYPVMLFLALLAGISIYIWQLRKDGIKSSNAFYIALFGIVGGTIGAKLPLIFMYWDKINSNANSLNAVLQGRTIVGGLIGGMVSILIAKRIFNIKERMGNQLAIPIAVAMAIGRVGCVLRGCCYGKETYLPWGIDFGDHILRHPTQIYEIIFDLAMAIYLSIRKRKGVRPGQLYSIFLNGYLSFRFFLEFIRVEKVSFIFLTDFQILCIVGLIFINRKYLFSRFMRREV